MAAGAYVTKLDIDERTLKFSPAANANGTTYTSFTFQVKDDGAYGGLNQNLGQSPNTMTINVTPLNDPPVASAATPATQTRQYGEGITPVTFSATDIDSPGSSLTATATGLPAGLTLTASGTDANSRNWTVSGCPVPATLGTYNVKVTVVDAAKAPSYTSFTITVIAATNVQPLADQFYIGTTFAWTTSSSATLTLSAGLKNAANSCGDNERGYGLVQQQGGGSGHYGSERQADQHMAFVIFKRGEVILGGAEHRDANGQMKNVK